VKFHGRASDSGGGFVWCGDVPPRHESLGEYRRYTDAEKLAGVVCLTHLPRGVDLERLQSR
jgi:hypothetical protein